MNTTTSKEVLNSRNAFCALYTKDYGTEKILYSVKDLIEFYNWYCKGIVPGTACYNEKTVDKYLSILATFEKRDDTTVSKETYSNYLYGNAEQEIAKPNDMLIDKFYESKAKGFKRRKNKREKDCKHVVRHYNQLQKKLAILRQRQENKVSLVNVSEDMLTNSKSYIKKRALNASKI